MKTYYKDSNLEITEKYIKFQEDVMPTSALSFFSYRGKVVNWATPILLILGGSIGYIGYYYFNTVITSEQWWLKLLMIVSIILFIAGIYKLYNAIVESGKKYCNIYSHSGHCISFETEDKKISQSIIDALFETIIMDDDSNIVSFK